jgi:hypothetical protein
MSDMEGKAAREAASKRGRRARDNVAGAGLQLPHQSISIERHRRLKRQIGSHFLQFTQNLLAAAIG